MASCYFVSTPLFMFSSFLTIQHGHTFLIKCVHWNNKRNEHRPSLCPPSKKAGTCNEGIFLRLQIQVYFTLGNIIPNRVLSCSKQTIGVVNVV